MTETNDMQDTGYMRNFVTVKSARFSIVVEDVLSGYCKQLTCIVYDYCRVAYIYIGKPCMYVYISMLC